MKVGIANIKGDIDFEKTLDGISVSGVIQDTTTSIAAASTFDLDVALGKGGWIWGMALLVSSSPPVDGDTGYTYFFTTASGDSHGMGSRISYTKYYSKLISSAWLSGGDWGAPDILLQDLWIDDANEKLVFRFYNKNVSSARTLKVQGTYGVHQ